MTKPLIFAVVALVLVVAIAKFGLGQRMKKAAIEGVVAAVVVGGISYAAMRGKA